jgi:hypothetical protein
LGFHGAFCDAIECFDEQVLFDLFEEEFDVPAFFVNACDSHLGQIKVIDYEDKTLTFFAICAA